MPMRGTEKAYFDQQVSGALGTFTSAAPEWEDKSASRSLAAVVQRYICVN